MRSLINLLGTVSLLGGLWFLGNAIATPFLYNQSGMSAIQATQLYSMATYNGVTAVGCFVFAGLCMWLSKQQN